MFDFSEVSVQEHWLVQMYYRTYLGLFESNKTIVWDHKVHKSPLAFNPNY